MRIPTEIDEFLKEHFIYEDGEYILILGDSHKTNYCISEIAITHMDCKTLQEFLLKLREKFIEGEFLPFFPFQKMIDETKSI